MPPAASQVSTRLWLFVAEHAALHALNGANRRLMRAHGRAVRHHSVGLRDIDPLLWHTRLRPATANVEVDDLLRGALGLFHACTPPCLATTARAVADAVTSYVRDRISQGLPHDRAVLAAQVDAALRAAESAGAGTGPDTVTGVEEC